MDLNFVKDFAINFDKTGLSVIKWTLVHFPYSSVQPRGLPENHVILTPIDYSFTTSSPGIFTDDNKPRKMRIKRQ